MQISGHLSTLLGALIFAVLLAVTSSRSLSLKEKHGVPVCSRYMACAWAICPWRNQPGPSFPVEDECLVIENRSCQCTSTYGCQLTDLMEPGRSNVKYEYRCMSPEVTREIYQMGRRRRQAPAQISNDN